MEFIRITEHRLDHILGVARKCYSLARDKGYPEDFCKRMWMIGWLHDVGYEFSTNNGEHPEVGEEMLQLLGMRNSTKDASKVLHAIRTHGSAKHTMTSESMILNTADLMINSQGVDVGVNKRLSDILARYGEESNEYNNSVLMAKKLKLL